MKEKYLLGMDAVLFLAARAEETFVEWLNKICAPSLNEVKLFVLKL